MSDDKESGDTLYCSFCGKSQHEVASLVAGPTVFICDECALLCCNIVAESAVKAGAPGDQKKLDKMIEEYLSVRTTLGRVLASVAGDDDVGAEANCSFCGKRRNEVIAMTEGTLGSRETFVCDECAWQTILDAVHKPHYSAEQRHPAQAAIYAFIRDRMSKDGAES